MAEVELKLELDPAQAETLGGRLAELLGPSAAKPLVSTYYDTSDRRLRAAGLSLRIRRSGNRYLQTIKADAGGNAGLFDRAEWEVEIGGTEPDPRAIADTPLDHLAVPAWSLMPLFSSEVERALWQIEEGDARIELAFDRGCVLALGVVEPFCELELELKEGEPATLFAWLDRLGDVGGMRLGVRSKADRGYALVEQGAGAASKAGPVLLGITDTAGEAFATIVRACLRHFRLNEPLILAAADAEAVHQARVALRRLRSALSLFRPLLSDPESEKMRAELKWLAALLGEARNLDVLIGHIDIVELKPRLDAARADVYDRVCVGLNSPRSRGLILDIARWAEAGDWRGTTDFDKAGLRNLPVIRFAGQLLDRRRRKFRKAGRDIAGLDPAERHDLRIAAKKLRYAAEFFAGLYEDKRAKKRRRRFLAALDRIQTSLGELNDAETGRDIIADLARQDPDPLIAQRLEALAAERFDPDAGKGISAAEAAFDDFARVKRFWC
ncbi:inorganic triphosphatase [Sphingomonas oleivorans]|uniref:Inorganic triphosphatase n=1 Tax=Sphingomonas oleivorans TaxID=1735121 RepID=A0A2T5FVK0_9SPHN|nr:CHAD domain-containing protein [Sphingomonas oleivorans]PTQ09803.1 inorganic triphosphatase [Sphingomonas oleivorans]